MGSADAAHQLLQYWISRHKSEFDPDATSSFEATLAHSIQNVSTSPGVCSCNVLVTPRLQNNYGTLNGGCMAALACLVAGTALDTVSARSGVVASSSIDYMSAMPGNAVVEVLAKVSAVTNTTAAVDVILQDAKSKRLVAKGRYTEQTPHGIRAKASSYIHNAATAARAAVQRLQQSTESIAHKAESVFFEDSNEEHAETAVAKAKGTASAYVASATASVKAAAQKLQHAAETVLHSAADTTSSHISRDDDSAKADSASQAASSAQGMGSRMASAAESASQSVSETAPSTQSSYSKSAAGASTAQASVQESGAAVASSAQSSASQSDAQSVLQSVSQSVQGAAASVQSSAAEQLSRLQNTLKSANQDSGGIQTNTVPQRAKQGLLQRAGMVTDNFKEDDCSCFDTTLGCLLKDIQVGEGKCTATLPTTARLSDQHGMLHPGCYCSLVDLISTTALAAADKRPAVSVTISVDFYAALPIGEELEIKSHVVKTGKSLTFAEVDFRHKSTGDLIAQGNHVEYSAGGAPYPSTIEEYHKQQQSRQQSSKL